MESEHMLAWSSNTTQLTDVDSSMRDVYASYLRIVRVLRSTQDARAQGIDSFRSAGHDQNPWKSQIASMLALVVAVQFAALALWRFGALALWRFCEAFVSHKRFMFRQRNGLLAMDSLAAVLTGEMRREWLMN
jgi:hypothetical protein